MLRITGPQPWVFQELADIARLRFRFADEEDACDYVSRLVADMPHYAPEHALCGPHLYEHWDPVLVSLASPPLLSSQNPAPSPKQLISAATPVTLRAWNHGPCNCCAQVADLLERMTPASCRIDLQTDSFKELIRQQGLEGQPGAYSGVEPW
jgi:secreted Zn-dependent insulinase-like peptidase